MGLFSRKSLFEQALELQQNAKDQLNTSLNLFQQSKEAALTQVESNEALIQNIMNENKALTKVSADADLHINLIDLIQNGRKITFPDVDTNERLDNTNVPEDEV